MHPLQNHLKPLEKNDYNTNRKGTGMPKVHRMRAIHIIEAEVQFIAKTFYILKNDENSGQRGGSLTNDKNNGCNNRTDGKRKIGGSFVPPKKRRKLNKYTVR